MSVTRVIVLATLIVLATFSHAAGPVASPAGGVFITNVSVTLTADAPTIRFTLDGTEPTTNATVYTSPVQITNCALLRARAFGTNGEAGATIAESYTLLASNVSAFSSDIPIVVINTFGRVIQPSSNAPAAIRFINTAISNRASIVGASDFNGFTSIKARGFSSLRYPKRSFGFETLDASGDSKPASILGLPVDDDWILYAPFPDKTLIRDALAYELSNDLGHYASRTRFVEVFVNQGRGKVDRTNYAGVYVLLEKVKRGEQRVAIKKLSAKDNAEPAITGGYIFKKDHPEEAGGAPTTDAPEAGSPFASRFGYPTGRGGFPADPAAFVTATDPAVASAISVVTNLVSVTNRAGTNPIVFSTRAVTIVATNRSITTNMVAVTNKVVSTNMVVSTNAVVASNVVVATKPVLVTNTVVASNAVAATNAVASTNAVDSATSVITTTVTVSTTTTFRTNLIPATNVVSMTNVTFATNMVAATNRIVVTNLVAGTAPVYITNYFIGTNTFVAIPPAPAPFVTQLVAQGEGFATTHSNWFFFTEPKPAKITAEQRAWLTRHVNQFEQALYGPDFRNPTNGYAAFIDVDSFIDHHLFVESTKNIDGYRFSTYFTKDRGGKIRMEPIWDWNLGFGNAVGREGYAPEGWYWPQLDDQQYSWFRRLFDDPDFAQRYVDRWAEWRTNQFTPAALTARIDAMAARLRESAARNFMRWPIIGARIGPEYFAGKTWDEDLAFLKTWITNRIAWMDAQFVAPPSTSLPGGEIASATNAVALTAKAGKIFYTSDGSDPRVSGGGAAPAAKLYTEAIPLTRSMTLKMRAQVDDRWSAPASVVYVVKPTLSASNR